MNRFLNYWSSIELLADHYYKTMVKPESKAVRRERIMKILADVEHANCLQKVEECRAVLEPGAKQRVCAGLAALSGGKLDGQELFASRSERSLYQTRNDIAHGNGCSHETDFQDAVASRLDEIRQISKAVILEAMARSEAA